MYPHTLRTRPRQERLAARTEYGTGAAAVAAAVVLALVHPAAVAVVLLSFAVRRIAPAPDGRSPTGHGRVRSAP